MRRILGGFENQQPTAVSLWGLPGIGKTQTSLYHAKNAVDNESGKSIYKQVVFLRANDMDMIQSEIRRYVVRLGLVNEAVLETLESKLTLGSFLKWLGKIDRWLLIFDNVSKSSDIAAFRPQAGEGHIIFTTRSKLVAELLCRTDKAVELGIFDPTQGVRLVRSLMGPSMPQSPEANDIARQVAAFAGGLPLAIEQLCFYARWKGCSLQQALHDLQGKQDLLRQQAIDSFHEENLSVGAILVATFEAVSTKFPMAGALFRLLAHFEPSSIPTSMLMKGAREMEPYFGRAQTYDRGTIRTPEAEVMYRHWSQRPKFHLFDYDGPLDRNLYKRLFHIGQFDRRFLRHHLPRVDSRSDIEMQAYWQNDPLLKRVFDDETQLTKAINQLEDSGLIKLPSPRGSLWIHDLFAELMMAYITATDPKMQSGIQAHVAATMVWLAFPVPGQRSKGRDLCLDYLPHAESCLRHLKEQGNLLIYDATIGAELSHVVASTMYRQSIRREARADLQRSVHYYMQAQRGYNAAQRRLVALWKGVDKLVIATQTDMTFEDHCQVLGKNGTYYIPARWRHECERFGANAMWRGFQTAGKIGQVLREMREFDQAEDWMRKAKRGIEWIWGPCVHLMEVRSISEELARLLMEKGDWDGALVVVEEMKGRYEEHWKKQGFNGGFAQARNDLDVTTVAILQGSCLTRLKRWDEGMKWYLVALREYRDVYGREGWECWSLTKAIACASELREDWQGSLRWWLECVAILVNGKWDTFEESWAKETGNGIELAKLKCEENGGICEELKKAVDKAGEIIEMWRERIESRDELLEAVGNDFFYGADWDDRNEESKRWLKEGRVGSPLPLRV
jgi:tetratricopeptide (TPR) repeat protein